MTDPRTYERLFCCECGKEVGVDAAARVMPALPGSASWASVSPRPHVWCSPCLQEEQEASAALPKPSELHGKPAFELHRFIWAVGEGRTDAELLHFLHREACWGRTLSSLLRELTDAGKIARRGDRRVALCAPWQEPPQAAGYKRPERRRCPHDGGTCHHSCAPDECFRKERGMALTTPHEGYPLPEEGAAAGGEGE